jgi:N utilization substance protein A
MTQKLDQQLIGYITTFENLTGTRVKDAYIDRNNILVFVVHEGDMGKALGKRGSHIQRIAFLLKKKIRVIEHHADVVLFIKHVLEPLQPDAITLTEDVVSLQAKDTRLKGLLLGRDKRNLHDLNALVQKYFKVKVQVV